MPLQNQGTNKNNFNWLPIIVLFIICIIFFYPILFEGKIFYAFDIFKIYYPWFSTDYISKINNYLINDPIIGYYHQQFFLHGLLTKSALNAGCISFWNPYIFCGTPLFPYSFPIYLPILYFFSIVSTHHLILFSSLFLSGLFPYLYFKEIKIASFPACIGAVIWMLNGYSMTWFEFEYPIIMSAMLALTLLIIEKIINKGLSKTKLIYLITALALLITGSHMNRLIFYVLFLIAYVMYRYNIRIITSLKKITKRSIILFTASLLAIILLCSSFFVSHIEMGKNSIRTSIPENVFFEKTGQLLPQSLLTLYSPNIFSAPNDFSKKNLRTIQLIPKKYKTQVYNNYNELIIYSGIAALVLSLCSIALCFREKFVSFYLLFSVTLILLAFGPPFYKIIYILPGMSFGNPTRSLCLFGFCLASLSAISLNNIILKKHKQQILIILLLFFIFTVGFFLMIEQKSLLEWIYRYSTANINLARYFIEHSFYSNIIKPTIFSMSYIFIFILLLLIPSKKSLLLKCTLFCLASYELISFGSAYNTKANSILPQNKSGAIELLKKDKSIYRIFAPNSLQFLPNSFIMYNIESIGGYSSTYSKNYNTFIEMSQNIQEDKKILSNRWVNLKYPFSPLLNLINTKYILAPPNYKYKSSNLNLIYDKEIKVYKNTEYLQRFFLVPHYLHIKNSKTIIEKLKNFNTNDFKEKIILEKQPKLIYKQDIPFNNISQSKVKPIKYSTDSIQLEIETPFNQFLVISNTFDKSWQAFVDKEPKEIYRANYIMQAIEIPKGKHNVSLKYNPFYLKWSFIVSNLSWLILFICITVCFIISYLQYFKRRTKHEANR